MDSLATKDDINQFRAEIQRVIDSLHNKVDKMESRVFDVEAENDELKTEIRKIQENNKDLKNRIDQYDKEKRQLRRNQNDHEQTVSETMELSGIQCARGGGGDRKLSCIKKCATCLPRISGSRSRKPTLAWFIALDEAGQSSCGSVPGRPGTWWCQTAKTSRTREWQLGRIWPKPTTICCRAPKNTLPRWQRGRPMVKYCQNLKPAESFVSLQRKWRWFCYRKVTMEISHGMSFHLVLDMTVVRPIRRVFVCLFCFVFVFSSSHCPSYTMMRINLNTTRWLCCGHCITATWCQEYCRITDQLLHVRARTHAHTQDVLVHRWFCVYIFLLDAVRTCSFCQLSGEPC